MYIPLAVAADATRGTLQLEAAIFRPERPGVYPLIVLSHGSPRDGAERARMHAGMRAAQAKALADLGAIVIAPMRRGYGLSDGDWVEHYGNCARPRYVDSGRESARDLSAAIDAMRRDPQVDVSRIALIGESAGGFASLALASQGLPGVRAVVSFAGGRGSYAAHQVCDPAALVAAFTTFAHGARVPGLWFYSANDQFFGPRLAEQFVAAYRAAGADLEYVPLPAFGADGHGYFAEPRTRPEWVPRVQQFLRRTGVLTD